MVDLTPAASNFLNSLGTFIHRENYKENVYPKDLPLSLDIWYEKQLYGKVNHNNNAVFPSASSLKQVNSKNVVFLINFVADAFNDFKKQFLLAKNSNRLSPNSELLTIDPVNGWKNLNNLYHAYITLLYKSFSEVFIKDKNRNENITDFNTFLRVFFEYINVISKSFPITKTAFIQSKFSSVDISGLSIQLKDEDHSIDKNKVDKFIYDENFVFYSKTARQYGFMIDKNAPWRLVADIESPAMSNYLKKYNLTSTPNVFNNLYYESFMTDIDVLKVYVIQFYNSLVNNEPKITKYKTSTVIKDETILETMTRKTITEEEINNKLDYMFWNKLYSYIRNKETQTNLNQLQFDTLTKTANQIEKKIDSKTAREYINKVFKDIKSINKNEINIVF